ncbi:MAG: hypothetical protein ERJ67_06655 [Aphanocapsa feldmannii 277cV]|uniref:Uncharacterized protein n=2 Tax=Aphanocapsa feldmannii TaxID=192050 RepID=A0A524RMY9_9CHRO|nr:MAG: hypothetical protein ERJ67_06655 [Aphanocapsa feldmannii 277cV]TGH23701.1 MAG: hypothetical protein ERJ68_03740 [Aphanocapsa feldmannii 277cI]
MSVSSDPVLEGVFGTYTITAADRREVSAYRWSVLVLALAQLALVLQWRFVGSAALWPWLVLMVLALGFALRWIHIYLKPLHRALQLLWLLGSLGFLLLALRQGPAALPVALLEQRGWIWLVGPYFAALTGLGFKEFFCFHRPEAIGLTLVVPLLLLGRLSGLLSTGLGAALLALQAALLLLLALRKFPMDPAADIGDKSVFEEMERRRRGQLPVAGG